MTGDTFDRGLLIIGFSSGAVFMIIALADLFNAPIIITLGFPFLVFLIVIEAIRLQWRSRGEYDV